MYVGSVKWGKRLLSHPPKFLHPFKCLWLFWQSTQFKYFDKVSKLMTYNVSCVALKTPVRETFVFDTAEKSSFQICLKMAQRKKKS